MNNVLLVLDKELKRLKKDLKYYKEKVERLNTDNWGLSTENKNIKRDLELANDIIKDLTEKLNNK